MQFLDLMDHYSLDRGDGIEIAALHKPEQPDELLMQAEEKQELERALASLSKTQRQRIIAHFIESKSKTAIAFSEGVNESVVRRTITRGLYKLKDYLKKFS